MTTAKHHQLGQAIGAIQRRWGPRAIGSSAAAAGSLLGIPTGFRTLDAALQTGIPRGRVTELVGQPTSGARTLALRVLAEAQRERQLVAYLDLGHTFDAEYAVHCGLELANVLLVQPASGHEALSIVQALLTTGEVGSIVVDETAAILREPRGAQSLSDALARYGPLLAGAHTALLFLTTGDAPPRLPGVGPGDALAHAAALRLLLERAAWRQEHTDILGYETRVSVLKHKRAPAMPPAAITITLPAV